MNYLVEKKIMSRGFFVDNKRDLKRRIDDKHSQIWDDRGANNIVIYFGKFGQFDVHVFWSILVFPPTIFRWVFLVDFG